MRIGFAGSGHFAEEIWQELAQAGIHPVLLVTAPPAARGRGHQERPLPLAGWAEAAGANVLAPVAWDEASLQAVSRAALDCLVVADYGRRLPVSALPLAINVHPSLLPRWRGAAPIQRALWHGDRYTGVSVMRVAEAIDAGPLYAQEAILIAPDDNAGTLSQRLALLGGRLLAEVLSDLEAGRAQALAQDSRGVRWARRLTGEEEWLRPGDLSTSSLVRRVRALSPAPGAKLTVNGRALKLLVVEAASVRPPAGELWASGPDLVLGTRDGGVRLIRVRPAGGREMAGADFWRGVRGGAR